MNENRGVQVKNCGFCKKCHTPFPIAYKKTFGGYCVYCAEKKLKSQYGKLIGSTIAVWLLTGACVAIAVLLFGKIKTGVANSGNVHEIMMFVYLLLIAAAINISPVAALVTLCHKLYMKAVSAKTNSKVAIFSFWGLIIAYLVVLAWSMPDYLVIYIPVAVGIPVLVNVLVYVDVAHLRKMLKHFKKATNKMTVEQEKPQVNEVIADMPYVS